jgi:hypothetical protein
MRKLILALAGPIVWFASGGSVLAEPVAAPELNPPPAVECSLLD